MSPVLRLEYACSIPEMDEAQTLSLYKRLGGRSKWRAKLVLYLLLGGMLVTAWLRFQEVPEVYRALVLAAIVGWNFILWRGSH